MPLYLSVSLSQYGKGGSHGCIWLPWKISLLRLGKGGVIGDREIWMWQSSGRENVDGGLRSRGHVDGVCVETVVGN